MAGVIELRYGTACIVPVGPFFDSTDGVTPEGALTVANEKIHFQKMLNDGSAPAKIIDNATGSTTGDNALNYVSTSAGTMGLALTAAQVSFYGYGEIQILDAANHCPVFQGVEVITASEWDRKFAAGASVADVKAETAAIKAKTDNLPASPAAVGSNMGTVSSVTGAVGSVAGLTASDVGDIKTTIGAAGAGLTAVALTAAYDPAKTAAQAGDAMALTAGERQQVRDAMKLAPSAGDPDAGSVDSLLAGLPQEFINVGAATASGVLAARSEAMRDRIFVQALTSKAGITASFDGVIAPTASLQLYIVDADDAVVMFGYFDDQNVWVPDPDPEMAFETGLLVAEVVETAGGGVSVGGTITLAYPTNMKAEPHQLVLTMPESRMCSSWSWQIDGRVVRTGLWSGSVTLQSDAVTVAAIEASAVLAKEATLGTPAGASIAADIAAIDGGAGGGVTLDQLRAEGLAKEATVLGQFGVTYGITYPIVRRDGVINLTRGDVATVSFVLNAAFPLTGKKVYFCAQKKKLETNATAIVNRACTITDVPTRACSITLTAEELATAGTYLYEIEVRNEDETAPATAEAGTLNIIEDLRK